MDGFEILSKLGDGSYSVVYKVRRKVDNNILDQITNIEDKSSSNDIMTNHTAVREEDNNIDKNEKSSINSPEKNRNYNVKNADIMQSQSYLPPSSNKYKVNKEELNNFSNNRPKKRALPRKKNK